MGSANEPGEGAEQRAPRCCGRFAAATGPAPTSPLHPAVAAAPLPKPSRLNPVQLAKLHAGSITGSQIN